MYYKYLTTTLQNNQQKMSNYQEIISDLDFLLYHQCVIYDIPLYQRMYMSFCYDDMLTDFRGMNYSEEQIVSLVNDYQAWLESVRNIPKKPIQNMISLSEINDLSEFESLL